ncbi:MAG: LarC family nickel insertion protein, partial [Anaerolineae bacterium]|nr:LarC family nickel insertion protein [Anaerolineae bacterium]
PFQGKKNRPGVLLSVLCHPHQADQLSSIIFAETTTLGIRQTTMVRRCLERETISVDTGHGQVRIKVARLAGDVVNLSPEYEDCRRLARETGKPLKEVYAAAQKAALLWRDNQS